MIGFPLCGKLSRSDSTLVWICHVVDWRGEACERPLRPRYNDTRDRAQLVVYEWVRVSPRDRKKRAQNGEQAAVHGLDTDHHHTRSHIRRLRVRVCVCTLNARNERISERINT